MEFRKQHYQHQELNKQIYKENRPHTDKRGENSTHRSQGQWIVGEMMFVGMCCPSKKDLSQKDGCDERNHSITKDRHST